MRRNSVDGRGRWCRSRDPIDRGLNRWLRRWLDRSGSRRRRCLNGTWATPPFLHNGAIPSLYLLLSTQQERDAEAREFYLGSRSFDPKYVGFAYRTEASKNLPDMRCIEDATGLFRLDTKLAGNRNTGHLFTDGDERTPGRIGAKLTKEERFALIEFLKSIDPGPVRAQSHTLGPGEYEQRVFPVGLDDAAATSRL